jgi:hypothetical protein
MVVAIAALVLATTSSAVAAKHYLITSSKQIKPGAISAGNLSNAARTTLRGDRGATGAQGPQGPKGDPGANFTIDTTLASGRSERGQYAVWGSAGVGNYLGTQVNFRIPLGADISSANTHFIRVGGPYVPGCPAVGQASPGNLCVYQRTSGNASFAEIYHVLNGVTGQDSPGRDGFQIYWDTTSTTGAYDYGEWVVTEP